MNHSKTLRLILLSSFIIGISLLHYTTPLHLPMLHDIFQRLYYIPIILAAFWFGFRGGIVSAIVVSILYAPHILFQWGGHLTMELEKYLEIILYNVVGGIVGFLAQKEEARREELQETARGLEESYKKLQSQAELIFQIEEQLRQTERLSALGELSAVLAHEIRNPLGSIRGTAEILRDDYRPGDKKHEFLEMMIRETERLNGVVEEFLRMARPQPAELSQCDIVEELGTIVSLVTAEARRRQVRLEMEPVEVPPVRGDREKLRQAFLNLLLNSLQATPAGGQVTVSLELVEGNLVEIRFKDTGSGIPREVIGKIFTPFFTTKEEGTGLGLAITRKIVEQHGGNIAVESEPGEGTTFIIKLSPGTGADNQ